MLSFEHKAGFFVLELDIRSERRPAFGCMAIAAGNFDGAVRIVRRGDLGFSSGTCDENEKSSADLFEFEHHCVM